MTNLVWTHPECRVGEVLFSNMSNAQYAVLDWNTKRKGHAAFDGVGNLLTAVDWSPIFVAHDELLQRETDVTQARAVWRKLNDRTGDEIRLDAVEEIVI